MKQLFTLSIILLAMNISQAQDKQIKQIEEKTARLVKALEDADEASLQALLSPQLVYLHSSGKVDTKASLIESLVSGASDFIKIAIADQRVQMHKQTAIVTHTLTADTKNNGQIGSTKLLIMLTWVKQNGDWKLVGRHATRLTT